MAGKSAVLMTKASPKTPPSPTPRTGAPTVTPSGTYEKTHGISVCEALLSSCLYQGFKSYHMNSQCFVTDSFFFSKLFSLEEVQPERAALRTAAAASAGTERTAWRF